MDFHHTIRPVLFVVQLFGQFPLQGILKSDPLRWHFRWCSVQTVLFVLLEHVGLFLCYIEYDRLMVIGVNADNLIGPLFYLDVMIIMGLLLKVAYQWPSMASKFQQVEALETMQYDAQRHGRQGARKIRTVALLLTFAGFAEHMLSIGKTMYAKVDEARVCNWNYSNFPEYYALRTYESFFIRVPYNFPTLIVLEYANTALTMAWTVQDVLIIIISDAIVGYFERINERIQLYCSVQVVAKEKFWCDIRSHYVTVRELLEQVMAIVSPLLVVSCGTNLYLICYQLFHIVEEQKYIVHTIFAYFSLLCVITRAFLTMNYCSAVHEVARKPVGMCRRIPSQSWCSELQRFHDHIRKNYIVISAMGLFNITRRTMLTMLGAVITYELVMLHFAKTTENQGVVKECSKTQFSYEPKMESTLAAQSL
ncbi:gustatory receptor for sugar taste 64a-like [Anopheles ziemanni]|uniref:gustatory receptor for sugar taste 64a-like n=1 Tax=Anopheles coustani TaxID=139045 RepID=UPI00265B6416|nr:gustatory receptor for sugar taste 64a-like [Anopheles coustani]XP_058169091.1 gustatory receptor for sugar taste 64a-like [Anopheles ziemanni]